MTDAANTIDLPKMSFLCLRLAAATGLDIFPVESSYFYAARVLALLNFTATYWILRCMALLIADVSQGQMSCLATFVNPKVDPSVSDPVANLGLLVGLCYTFPPV